MSTIFPGSASVGQIFDGYSFNGTAWDLIGNEFNPTSFSPTAPDNPKAGDLWVDSNSSVPSISPENILTTSSASSIYLSQLSASSTYLTQTSASENFIPLIGNLRIKQIISGSTTTEVFSSTNTYVDTTLTATITPTSSSNKVIVMYQQGTIRKSGGNQNSAMDLILLRDATQLAYHGALYTVTALELRVPGPGGTIVDSPATTSAVTYKTQFRNGGNFDGVAVQIQNSRGSIILIEVEGL